MRLIGTLSPKAGEDARFFSHFLTMHSIENESEEVRSDSAPLFHIWVYNEDDVPRATEYYHQYKKNPKDPIFSAITPPVDLSETLFLNDDKQNDYPQKPRRILSPSPYGPLTVIILLIAVFLFIWTQVQSKKISPPAIPGVVSAAVLPKVTQNLLYDYPQYFEIRDELIKVYTKEDIEQKNEPNAHAKSLLKKLKQTEVWNGLYDRFVSHFLHSNIPFWYHGPIFEKISQGQIWRFFTPAVLHYDFLHIFFNSLWFILLGNQIEYRIGKLRYLFLIFVVAIVSNTAQYLMSGPFFMGLSGIICGMAAFIWARQRKAPWEGYLLHRFTLLFLAIFVIGMFFLQLVFFILQLAGKVQTPFIIANTAHIVGGIVGYLLGRTRMFSVRHQV